MAINKNLIHFKTKLKFLEELANGNILETSIVFILETTEIYTHGLFYDGSTFDPSNIEKSIENIINNKVDKTELPTKTSDLTNDSGFITINDIPDEYVTETELSQKGFLVSVDTSETLDDVETNTYVKYVALILTEEQKAQARENIGVSSSGDGSKFLSDDGKYKELYTKTEIDSKLGDINTILESIING